MVDFQGFSIALFDYRRDISTFDPCWLQIDSLGAFFCQQKWRVTVSRRNFPEINWSKPQFPRVYTCQNPSFPDINWFRGRRRNIALEVQPRWGDDLGLAGKIATAWIFKYV